MQISPHITLRNMERSEALEGLIRDEIESLERFYDRITTCRVAVDMPHHHRERGNAARVRIEIVVPGEELVIAHEPSPRGTMRELELEERAKSWEPHAEYEHRDAYLAVRDAFRKARRVLEDYVRRMRGDVKTHAPAPSTEAEQAEQEE